MIVPRGWRTTTLRRFRRVSSAHPSRSVLQLASGASPPNMLPQPERRRLTDRAPRTCIRNCRWIWPLTPTKSQPRTGHTREPDPTHNELKHTITRKKAIDLSTDREDPRPRRVPHPSPPSVHRQAPGGPHTSHRSGHHRYTPVLQHTFHRVCSPPLARRFGRPHRRANRAPCPARRRASSELSSRPTGAFMG